MMFEYVCQTWTLSPYGLAPIFVGVSIINIQHNMTYEKNFESTTKFIHELTQEEVTISGLPFTEKEARLSINERRPSFLLPTKEMIKMIAMDMEGTTQFKSLEVSMSNENYEISRANLSFSSEENGDDYDYTCQIKFSRFMDSRWDEEAEYFYRLFLPIKEHNWRDLVHSTAYYQHSVYRSTPTESLIRIDFGGGGQVHVFSIRSGQDNFLVIESQFPCTYNDMNRYMYVISLSLGLVTTIAPFDYVIVVTSKTSDFEGEIMGGIVKLRSTIKSQHRFITTDISELYKNLKEKVDYDALSPYCGKDGNLLRSYLDPMTEQEFSALARMLYENKALARATLILLLTPMVYEFMGALYSVVLETICSALTEDKEGAYMESKDWKSVLPELKKTLSDFCEEHSSITDEHKDVMIKKLDDFNRQTNRDKLKASFERIGYKLSGPENKVIGDRNRFLHGNVHEYPSDGSLLKSELLYSSMELRKLCGILLFRYAGYKGPILNNAVEIGFEEALANKEPLFITYEEKTESPQLTEKPETSV